MRVSSTGSSSAAALLPSALLPLLLLLPGSLGTAAAGDRSACVQAGAVELSKAAACGDKGSLEHCFKNVPLNVEPRDLETCFRNAGCTAAEAAIEASFIIRGCDTAKSPVELRRRAPEPLPAPTPAPAPQDTATATAANNNNGFTPSIQCSTQTLVQTSSCPIQSTGTESGRTLPCFQTEVATQVCAAENICMKDNFGIDTCMRRKDTLDTSAIIVTIFLAICFASSFATLIFLCCREKRNERKLRARKEAAAIAKASAADAANASVAAAAAAAAAAAGPAPSHVPPRLPSPGVGGPAGGVSNPFADGSRF
ncbi:hypothetical protein AAE478_002235 [Parahypoxylon ruwenzoriense]